MPFAVELYMDESTTAAVRTIWQSLVDAGIPSLPLSLGARPHVSLCVYESLDPAVAGKQLETFAREMRALSVELDTVDTFSGSNGVVFLSPRPSPELFDMHVRFHNDFARHSATASAHYLPGNGNPIARWQRIFRPNRLVKRSRFVEKRPFLSEDNSLKLA